MLDVQGLKVVVLFTLLTSTFLFSMLPLKVISIARKQVDHHRRRLFLGGISLSSCFAAGVFLATCLLDLFPGVQEKIQVVQNSTGFNTTFKFPVSEFLMAFGMFLILIVEQIVITIKEQKTQQSKQTEPLLFDRQHISNVQAESENEDVTGILSNPDTRSRHDSQPDYQSFRPRDAFSDPAVRNDFGASDAYSDTESEYLTQSGRSRRSSVETDHGLVSPEPQSHSFFRALMLLLALSLHSVLEGLAVGLQPTYRDVLEIFAALALHKSVLAFSLGLSLVQSQLSLCATIKSNLLFALASPVGIAIGILILDLSPDQVTSALVTGILEGLACGTFLYVVFFEVLPHEFHRKRRYPSKLLKVLLLLLGFSTVTILLLVSNH